jgi:hypothetical protein
MKKIKVLITATLVASLLGITSFAAVSTLPNGAKTIDSADIIVPLNENAAILDDHIDNVAGTDVLGHVKIGSGLQTSDDGTTSAKIANDFTTSDSETALSAAMGKELYDSFREYSKSFYGVGGAYKDGCCYVSYNFPITYSSTPTVTVSSFQVDNETSSANGTCEIFEVTNDYVVFKFTKNSGSFTPNACYPGCRVNFTVTSND